MNKHGNRWTTCRAGHNHQSAKESRRCDELHLMLKEKHPVIKDLKQQPEFTLQEGYPWNGKKIRAIKYRADFSYFDIEKDIFVIEDTKGYKTQVYRLKKKLLLKQLNDKLVEFIES